MKKKGIAILVMVLVVSFVLPCSAQRSGSADILRAGLLGAGAGAIGGVASGARGEDVWKGALAGAGMNIIGGALLDAISGETVQREQPVSSMPSRDAYSSGYQDGYTNGYKAGYMQGFKDGLRESE